MDAAVIKFKASGQQLSVVSTNLFAANTVSYIRAEFELGYNWDGWDSVRAVWATDFAKIATVLDSDGACMIPWEVLKRTATLYVNLVGSISDGDEVTDRLTTYKVRALDVNGCTNVDGDNTQPITPSQFEQFVEVVHNDAEAAADARDEARGYASDAEGYRDEAVGAAADAKDYRDAAKGYADDAEDYKDQAKSYRDEAEADAEEIRNMSATATTLPEGSSATASYSDGVLSLGIPRGNTGATGATGNGIASAVLNADYTLTLNFTNGTHYSTPPIRGAQGVQGETGNGIESVYLTATHGAVKTYTILFTDGTTTTFDVTDGEVTLAELASVLPTDTASGAIASFEDGSDLFDYLSCVVEINPVQAGSGTPSPQNVRPITGWTGCEVSVVGFNQFNKSTATIGKWLKNDYSGNMESVSGYNVSDYIKICPNTTYYKTATGSARSLYYDANKNAIGGAWAVGQQATTFTTPSNAYYIRFTITDEYLNSTNINLSDASLNGTYEPYNPNSHVYTITWQTEAGTVYGGTVDLVTGVLTIDCARRIFDGSESGSNLLVDTDTTRCVYSASFFTPPMKPNATSTITIMADCLPVFAPDYIYSNDVMGVSENKNAVSTGLWIRVNNSLLTETSMEGLQQWLSDNPLTIKYQLATPQTYQLTPVQMACLLGQNNVWADCGDIDEVKYKADVQLYIEKMLNA